MSANAKTAELLELESVFKEIKANPNGADHHLGQIKRILARTFELDFKISIIENKQNNFFGMSIYPELSTVDAMVQAILTKRPGADIEALWQKNKQWVLEIDSILLFDHALNANPSEIVAVLLHEIGHIVYSNSVPQRINKIMRYKIMTTTYTIKKLLEWKRIQRLFDLVIVEACSSKNYHYVNVNSERIADKFALKMGYGDALDHFIDKLISTYNNSLVNRPDHEMDQDVKSIVNWTLDNVSELEFRKTKLRNSLQTEMRHTPSKYIRSIVIRIKDDFFGKAETEDGYKAIVNEQFLINGYRDYVKEGFLGLFDKYGKLKKLSQSDIDILSIETNRIKNEDDKIYVLDRIYDELDLITTGLELIAKGEKDKVRISKDTLMDYKSQLEKMRKQVLDTDVRPKSYGLFIKYPKGYES